jgi:hypothetical protein
MAEENYLGNPLLKRAFVKVDLTEEQIIELGKCAMDPVYFAKTYMKIVTLDHGLQSFDMYDFQKDMINNFHENRFNICLLSRQCGKCVGENTLVKIRNKKTNEVLESQKYKWLNS